MAVSLADRLVAAVSPSREHTAIVIAATYQPTKGRGGPCSRRSTP